jgi:hypothetical protein
MELEAGEESDPDILLFSDEPAFLVSKWLKHAVSHLEQYLYNLSDLFPESCYSKGLGIGDKIR